MPPIDMQAQLRELLSVRLVLVTGKGGVGKTTLAAALARLATGAGQRVLLCEMGTEPGKHSPLLTALGDSQALAHAEPTAAGPNLWTVILTPEAGHRAFLRDVLPLGFIADRALRAEPIKRFLHAAPAFMELGVLYRGLKFVQSKKRGRHEFDLVIIDAPATGHALAFATLPQILLKVIPGGPIGRAAREGIAVLHDPAQTRALVTTLPETLPVSEALELAEGLRKSNLTVHGIVANLVPRDPFSPAEHDALSAALGKVRVLGSHALDRLRRAQAALLRLEQAVGRVLVVGEQQQSGALLVAAVAQDLAGAR